MPCANQAWAVQYYWKQQPFVNLNRQATHDPDLQQYLSGVCVGGAAGRSFPRPDHVPAARRPAGEMGFAASAAVGPCTRQRSTRPIREMAVACDMSPQFTSLDAGKTWSRVDFRQLQSNHKCAIRFTKDPNIRWAIDFSPFDGGELARPTRSSDGGKTWHALAEDAWPRNRTAYVLYADYENPDRVAVSADYRELWITLDGGRSFEKKITGADRNAGLHLAGTSSTARTSTSD